MSFEKITERSSHYDNLETMSAAQIVAAINREDHCVADAVERALPQIARFVELLTERMRRGGRLFYIGAGTSGRLGVLDASEIPPTFGMPPTVVVGIIAGGDTALRNPVEGGILTASIACNPDSPLAHEAEIPIEVVVGPEFVTGSSRMKAGTAQKMTLNMISTAAMIGLGRVKGNRMVNMQLTNAKLVDRGTRMIVEASGLPYERAQRLLLLHGSVAKAMAAIEADAKAKDIMKGNN